MQHIAPVGIVRKKDEALRAVDAGRQRVTSARRSSFQIERLVAGKVPGLKDERMVVVAIMIVIGLCALPHVHGHRRDPGTRSGPRSNRPAPIASSSGILPNVVSKRRALRKDVTQPGAHRVQRVLIHQIRSCSRSPSRRCESASRTDVPAWTGRRREEKLLDLLAELHRGWLRAIGCGPAPARRPPRSARCPSRKCSVAQSEAKVLTMPTGSATPLASTTRNSGRSSLLARSRGSAQQVVPNGAADAAVRELDRVFVFHVSDQLRVDIDRAEVIHHDCQLQAMIAVQQTVQKCRLARAEKTSQDSDGDGPSFRLSLTWASHVPSAAIPRPSPLVGSLHLRHEDSLPGQSRGVSKFRLIQATMRAEDHDLVVRRSFLAR